MYNAENSAKGPPNTLSQFSGAAGQFVTIPQTAVPVPTPHTISSAISRMDGLTERLNATIALVNNVADQIGGPRPANKLVDVPNPPSPSAVHRLNVLADTAHRQLTDIEEALASIGRALG